MGINPDGPVLPKEYIERMERNMSYRFVGPSKHSAVKVCTWTKHALCGEGSCYKEKFYGISSASCMEMTPAVPFCTESCQFCWRLRELNCPKWVGPADPPDIILDECISERAKLLEGFSGNENAIRTGLSWQARKPTQVAISLDGEPMLYPHINGLVAEVLGRKMTAFLVTNGTLPERIKALDPEPTNLYVTVAGPNKKVLIETAKPLIANSWELLMESLSLLKGLSCETVLRLTLVRGLNMMDPQGYAELIRKNEPKNVEVKAFMSVSAARERLPYEAMPLHPEIKAFAEKIAELSGYRVAGEHEPSRVVLLKS